MGSCASDGRVDFLHQGQEVQAYLVARVFVLQVGAVGDVRLALAVEVVQEVIAREAEQGADDVAVAWADTSQAVDARAPHQVEEEGLHAVVGMVGHGYGVGAQLLTEGFEPLVAQLACGHFDGDVSVGGVLRGVEVDDMQGDVPFLAQVTDELLVAVGLLAAQVKVAMRRFACIAQLR